MADEQPQQAPARQLLLQKVYIKDLSFESPKAPNVFNLNAAPQTQLNIRSSAQTLAPNVEEVTLTLTVEAKDNDTTLFLVELAQAGIFHIQGYSAEERAMIVGSFCPNTLYPFAREAIADVIGKGGFPPLLLQPINFDALYAQAARQRAAQQSGPQAAPAAQPADGAAQPADGGEAH
ncbi:MAG TPA: protein-export chaperone SecB [Gammaproteobacteria bacterium]